MAADRPAALEERNETPDGGEVIPKSTPDPPAPADGAAVPHERHGLGNRNVGAPLHEFFPDGSPSDPNFQAVWSAVRRKGLTDAVRRGGAPYFRVFQTPIDNNPIHVHGQGSHPHDDDHFARGMRCYGPLGYALLRSQLVVLPEQWRRSGELHERYEALIEEMAAARAEGVAHHALNYVEGSRLIFWEALGLLLSVSEQLAVLVLGVEDWERGRRDFGLAIVGGETQPHRVFGRAPFTNDDWWKRQLQLHETYDDMPDLTPRQRELLGALSAESLMWVRAAVTDLHSTWNRELHRVATRYKHSFTLLSASHGVAWPTGEQTRDGDLIGELHSGGGLIVADRLRNGDPVQLAVEITIGGMELLLITLTEAVALTEALVEALIKKAETVTGRVLPIHPFTMELGTADELLQLAVDFSGLTPDQWQRSMDDETAKMGRRQAIMGAAARQRASKGMRQSPEGETVVETPDQSPA